MNRLKTMTLVAAFSMFAAASCSKDTPTETPATTEATDTNSEESATGEEAAPSAADTLNTMAAGCDTSAEARAARHAEKPLYERLGGHDPIMAVTKKIIELHVAEDSPIKDMFATVDLDMLAEHVVNFVGTGTGGQESYGGRSMKEAHAHLSLTPEQVLAAGEDIMQALAHFEVPQNETEEFMCIILSLKDEVLAPT